MPDDPQEKLIELRARIDAELEKVRDTQYAEAVEAEYQAYLERDASVLTWAPYELAYDSPDKAQKDLAEGADSIVTTLAAAVDRAEKELIVISPYFVPRKSGIEFFQKLRDRGLEVTVITNSLAATNHAIVHSGYAPSRKPLLKMGVKIFEVKHTVAIGGVERGGGGASLATLHTKAFIVDRDELFVGSFNWDPRSIHINTELGVIIKSPQLAGNMAALVDGAVDTKSYEVILNEKGKLRWVDRSSGEDVILTKEPDTTWGRRFNAGFMRILPVRGQL
jgi:putative cardiolipin synthase